MVIAVCLALVLALTVWIIKQTNCKICIKLYNYTVHCTIKTRAQSVRRQHRKKTSEKNEMVIYNNSTQVERNM